MNNRFSIISCLFLVMTTILLAGCEQDSDIKEYVYPEPQIEGMTPVSGYAGTRLAITGSDFGNYAEAVKVYFGEIQAKKILSCNNNCIVVEVPEDAVDGDVSVQVWTHLVPVGHFEIWPSPSITEFVTPQGTSVVAPGETITIKGTGFGHSEQEVSVRFGATKAFVADWSETEVKAIAPENYQTGEVILTVNGFDIVAGTALNPNSKGDVSMVYLKNYCQPFQIAPNMTEAQLGSKADFYFPADWIINEAGRSYLNKDATERVSGLNNDNLFLQAGWGGSNFENGKLYQTTNLPKGKYRLTLTMKEYGVRAGSLMYFVVNTGNELVDVDKVVENETVKGFQGFEGSDMAQNIHTIDFELENVSTEISLGFVCSFHANSWLRATEIKLELL